jgi:hypothetical protein
MGCSKKEDTYDVTFQLYSTCTPYTFDWSAMNVDYSEQVSVQNYSKTITVTEDDFDKQMGIIKSGLTFPDSIYVRASFNGLSIEQHTSIKCACSSSIMVQLNQAK